MFDKKHKREEQIRNDQWSAEEKKFDNDIKAAGETVDPAEKIIALKKITKEINKDISDETAAAGDKIIWTAKKTFLAGTGASVAGGVTALALLTGPVGLAGLGILYGGIIGSGLVSKKRGENAIEKFEQDIKGHVKNLTAKGDQAGKIIDETIAAHFSEISQSPLYPKLLELPGLSQKFAVAAANHIAEQQKLAQEAADAEAAEVKTVEAQPQQQLKQAPKKKPVQKEDYGKIIKAVRPK